MKNNPLAQLSPAELEKKLSDFLSGLTKEDLSCHVHGYRASGSEKSVFELSVTRVIRHDDGTMEIAKPKPR